jgi:hypothetical protein
LDESDKKNIILQFCSRFDIFKAKIVEKMALRETGLRNRDFSSTLFLEGAEDFDDSCSHFALIHYPWYQCGFFNHQYS